MICMSQFKSRLMNSVILSSIVLVPLFLTSYFVMAASNIEGTSSLTGLWLAYNYACNGTLPPEQIDIEQVGNDLTATKITGDDCVPADEITWMGTFQSGDYPIQFDVQVQVSSGPGTNLYFVDGTATIMDAKFIIISVLGSTLYFHKVDNPPPPTFVFDLEGIWFGTGYNCPLGSIIPHEAAQIEVNNNFVTATKIIGDDCVASGEITWTGLLTTSQGPTEFPIQMQVGLPGGVNLTFVDGTLQVVSEDMVVAQRSGVPHPTVFRKATDSIYLPTVQN